VTAARKSMEEDYVRKAMADHDERKKRFKHYYERYSNHLDSLNVSCLFVCNIVLTETSLNNHAVQ